MSMAHRAKRTKGLSGKANSGRAVLPRVCSIIVVLTVAGFPCAVWAQAASAEAGSATGPNTAPVLDEIVVTAEKRQSTVQDVPVSITAISGADLDAEGITSFSQVAQQVPGISMKTSGPGQTEYEMRGITSTGGQSPTVGLYLDDAPLTPPATAQNGKVAIDPSLYDLQRVEILRGPQGTLYGAGSMGGTIKLVTNKPDLTAFHASAEAVGSTTEGGGGNYGANAMFNLPLISDKLALRIVGTDEYTNGWIDRIVLNPFPLETGQSPGCAFYGCTRGNVLAAPVEARYTDVNYERLQGGRAILRAAPTDRLILTATALYQRISMGGPDTYDDPPGTLAHFEAFNVPEPFEDTFSIYSLVADYEFDWANLTSATSYWTRRQSQTQDDSEVLQDAFGLDAFDTADGGLGAASLTEIDTSHQFSEELRLSSRATDPLSWLVGGFYSHYGSTTSSYSFVPGLLTVFGGGVFNTSDFITVDRPSVIDQRALFGQASYDLTRKLTLTGGLRYFSYSTDIVSTETGIVSPSGGTTPTTSVGSASATGLSPKATLSATPARDLLVYFTAAKGFRPGAGNMPVPISGPDSCATSLAALGKTQAPLQYGPDSVWSYELGQKAQLLDHRVAVNSAVYLEQWNGVQEHVVLGCGFNYTDNAGDAQVYGSELETQVQITPHWQWMESAGYTHAALSSVTPETGGQVGQRLPDVPTWTASSSFLFKHPVDALGDFFARVQYDYVGPMVDLTYGRNRVQGYAIASARAGISSGGYQLDVFVDNLGNTQANLGDTVSYSENLPTFNRVATNQPRTVGLELRYQY